MGVDATPTIERSCSTELRLSNLGARYMAWSWAMTARTWRGIAISAIGHGHSVHGQSHLSSHRLLTSFLRDHCHYSFAPHIWPGDGVTDGLDGSHGVRSIQIGQRARLMKPTHLKLQIGGETVPARLLEICGPCDVGSHRLQLLQVQAPTQTVRGGADGSLAVAGVIGQWSHAGMEAPTLWPRARHPRGPDPDQVRGAAHGGQVVVSAVTVDLVREALVSRSLIRRLRMSSTLQRVRFTATEYTRMASIPAGRRTELIDEEIIEMVPIGTAHLVLVDHLERYPRPPQGRGKTAERTAPAHTGL
jgi:hypothetical protein